MGGPLILHEHVGVAIVYQSCQMVEILECVGWFAYFLRLQVFDDEISLEFTQTLHGSITQVKGLNIIVNEEFVVWVTGLETEGELWFNRRVYNSTLKDKFTRGTNE